MPEYIERDKVLAEEEFFGEHATWDNPMVDGCMAVRSDFIMNLPAADVAPVIHAYWIPPAYPYPWYKAKCSNCGVEDRTSFGGILNEGSWNQKIWKPIYKYCPNCGAKMDE